MYRERPSGLGGGTVLWTRTADPAPAPAPVLPDGCMDLIWRDGAGGGEGGSGFVVAGPDTRAQEAPAPPGTAWTGLRFAPGTGPAVLGVPARELRDLRVPLDALWPAARVRRLAGEVAGAADRGAALEAVAARAAVAPDPLHGAVARALARGRPVADVARRVGLSERQLHRRSLDAFGYGPKTLARILRLQRALTRARAGAPLARVAALTGYADQAHLTREARALTGRPVGALLRVTG
ncbi:helix-turn-helix transcriptional regulator [Streptomyces chumphonensis]|uniref:Helix-turn-helix domain-containing protein n=1 Tax=Streptomyces chumphonensis TaxID=1214925 RepID=A0A927IBJ9_9ACTN|nr:helix-turn-helix domain-containing protein [Streptomyces chumphonensis]MBD3930644.1 helix-turn-helix domain-containing protein [Streptomyces chumphonensis]